MPQKADGDGGGLLRPVLNDDIALSRRIGVAGDVDEKLLHRNLDVDVDAGRVRTMQGVQNAVHKLLHGCELICFTCFELCFLPRMPVLRQYHDLRLRPSAGQGETSVFNAIIRAPQRVSH